MKKTLIPFIFIISCCFCCETNINNKTKTPDLRHINIENKIKQLGPPDEVSPGENNEMLYVWHGIQIGNVTHALNKPDEVYRGVFPGEVPKITLFINLLETYDDMKIFQHVFRWGHYYFFEVTNWAGTKTLACIHTDRKWQHKINKDELKIMWNELSEKQQTSMLEKAIKADGSLAVKKGLVILLGFTEEQAQNLISETRKKDLEELLKGIETD